MKCPVCDSPMIVLTEGGFCKGLRIIKGRMWTCHNLECPLVVGEVKQYCHWEIGGTQYEAREGEEPRTLGSLAWMPDLSGAPGGWPTSREPEPSCRQKIGWGYGTDVKFDKARVGW